MSRSSFIVRNFDKLEILGIGTTTLIKSNGSSQNTSTITHQYEYAPMIFAYVKIGSEFFPLPYFTYDANGTINVHYFCQIGAKTPGSDGFIDFIIDIPSSKTSIINSEFTRSFTFFIYKERRII